MKVKNNNILFFLPALHFNEVEYLVIKQKLVKAGLKMFITSDTENICVGNFNLKVKADINLFNVHETNFSGIVFIGGTGARNYWDNKKLHRIAIKFIKAEKIVAAICNAPVILARAGILENLSATCFPEDKMELIKSKVNYKDEPVVVDGNIITCKDPESSSLFADIFIQNIVF